MLQERLPAGIGTHPRSIEIDHPLSYAQCKQRPHTQNRRINFAELAPGEYSFEAQSQNEDGIWSESIVWAFAIRPPFWQSW